MRCIFSGDYPDPTILRVGTNYYMTHSGLVYAPGLLIWHSKDLINWKPVVRALRQYDGDVWAPELVHHYSKFYIYYPTGGRNHVVVADSIEGPWSEPIDINIGHIDPGHVVGADGKRYLHLSGGHVVELTPDGLAANGPIRKVYDGWKIPEEWRIEGSCLESPKVIYRDGYYHMIVAQGGTAGPATSHMIVHARSRTPVGPWENSPYNPIVRTASSAERWWSRGHGTLVDGPDGATYIVYHAYENGYKSLGRQVLLEPIEWLSDGWLRVVPESADNNCGGRTEPSRLDPSDDFSGREAGIQWQFFGGYEPERCSIKDGALVLQGKASSPSDSSPFTCISGDHAYEISVEVELKGDVEAGLLLYYNAACYAAITLSAKGIRLGWRGQLMHFYYPAEAPAQTLRIVNDHQEVDFWVGAAGPGEVAHPLRKLPESIDVSGYQHENFGGYLSLRPGLFCAGVGEAHFRHFRYRSLN